MTALAMIIGMAPMALSAELNAPLGRAVIGGLVCSTIATLLFVPAVFRLVHERRPSHVNERAPHFPAEAKPI
jgi:multidrug efflux pump subunit AcrB